jgi:hypothetical protein
VKKAQTVVSVLACSAFVRPYSGASGGMVYVLPERLGPERVFESFASHIVDARRGERDLLEASSRCF